MAEKRYTSGDLTVIWKPALCTHSGNCVRGLPTVFNLKERPWIDIHGAERDEIMKQISKCPSGALSFVIWEENH